MQFKKKYCLTLGPNLTKYNKIFLTIGVFLIFKINFRYFYCSKRRHGQPTQCTVILTHLVSRLQISFKSAFCMTDGCVMVTSSSVTFSILTDARGEVCGALKRTRKMGRKADSMHP